MNKTNLMILVVRRSLGALMLLLAGLSPLPAQMKQFDQAMLGASYHTPLQTANWPLKIGPESQLFVDDYLIHSKVGIVRAPHQPVKYSGNPILVADRPWELQDKSHIYANGSIMFDPESKQYRMYYDGAHVVAFSKDGVNWTKPNLGLIEYKASKDNNIVIDYSNPTDIGSFIYDPRDPDPSRRWKAAIFHYDRGENPRWAKNAGQYGDRSGVYAFYSKDGLDWGKDAQMILPGRRGKLAGSTWPLTGVDDVTTVTWDEGLKKFVAWMKVWDLTDGRYYRARSIATSDDFTHWSQPLPSLLPDKKDPPDAQFYGMTGWYYEGMWLGLLRTLHSATGSQQVDLQLVTSRDGIHWERALNRAAFIPSGPEGSHDHGYHSDFASPPLRIGDELYFYYAGTPYGKVWVPSEIKSGICLAKLRVDGFASLHAAGKVHASPTTDTEHAVITRPLDFTGRELFVNAKAGSGAVRVEVLTGDTDDKLDPIPGFTAKECVAVSGDGIELAVRWQNHQDLGALAGKRIRLKFYLEGFAGLYSFKIR